MGFILTTIGTLLLVASMAGVGLGVYMAADPATRESGKLFAVWWVAAVAAASGVLMRDVVTFAVGAFCFLLAGAVFTLESESMQRPGVKRTGVRRGGSEKTTRENRARDDRAAF